MKTAKNNDPAEWQKDASRVMTDTVQYWRNGVMLTAVMPNEKARQLVKEGAAFVITSQAIGAIVNGGMFS